MADRKHGHSQPGTDTEVRHQDWDGRDLSSVDPLTVELNRTIIDVDQAVTLAVHSDSTSDRSR